MVSIQGINFYHQSRMTRCKFINYGYKTKKIVNHLCLWTYISWSYTLHFSIMFAKNILIALLLIFSFTTRAEDRIDCKEKFTEYGKYLPLIDKSILKLKCWLNKFFQTDWYLILGKNYGFYIDFLPSRIYIDFLFKSTAKKRHFQKSGKRFRGKYWSFWKML